MKLKSLYNIRMRPKRLKRLYQLNQYHLQFSILYECHHNVVIVIL